MQEQYDFFAIGQRHANDAIEEIKKLADEYEQKYGKQAREEFESGIASEMSQYMQMQHLSDYVTPPLQEHMMNPEKIPGGSIKYGEHGHSKPYIPRLDEVEGYDPNFDINAPHHKK